MLLREIEIIRRIKQNIALYDLVKNFGYIVCISFSAKSCSGTLFNETIYYIAEKGRKAAVVNNLVWKGPSTLLQTLAKLFFCFNPISPLIQSYLTNTDGQTGKCFSTRKNGRSKTLLQKRPVKNTSFILPRVREYWQTFHKGQRRPLSRSRRNAAPASKDTKENSKIVVLGASINYVSRRGGGWVRQMHAYKGRRGH